MPEQPLRHSSINITGLAASDSRAAEIPQPSVLHCLHAASKQLLIVVRTNVQPHQTVCTVQNGMKCRSTRISTSVFDR